MVSFWLQVLAVHIIITVILVPAETQLGPEYHCWAWHERSVVLKDFGWI